MLTSSSGEGGGKEEEDDGVSIYFRVDAVRTPGEKFKAQDWFVFKSGGGGVGGWPEKAMSPVFPRQPKVLRHSGCVAVDSFIYVIGGEERENHRSIPKRLCDVYYIDTLDPDSGWKKLAYSLNKPRAYVLAFLVNGVIYAMGGCREISNRSIDTSVSPEIFFPHVCPESGLILGQVPPRFASADNSTTEGWFPLTDSKEVPTYFHGHAVLDEGKRIILHSGFDPNLYAYDVEADSWEIYSKSFGLRKYTSAFVDGILYYLDCNQPGILLGLDVSSPDNLPKKVIGLDIVVDDDEDDWIPSSIITGTYLVSLGGGKLAVIWCPRVFPHDKVIDVCCSRIRMSKVENEAGGVDYVAHPVSRSLQCVTGGIITDFVAVNNKTGSINRNRYKDHMRSNHRRRNDRRSRGSTPIPLKPIDWLMMMKTPR